MRSYISTSVLLSCVALSHLGRTEKHVERARQLVAVQLVVVQALQGFARHGSQFGHLSENVREQLRLLLRVGVVRAVVLQRVDDLQLELLRLALIAKSVPLCNTNQRHFRCACDYTTAMKSALLTSDKAQSVHARRTADVGTHRLQTPTQLQDGSDPVPEHRMQLLAVEHFAGLQDDHLLVARLQTARNNSVSGELLGQHTVCRASLGSPKRHPKRGQLEHGTLKQQRLIFSVQVAESGNSLRPSSQ